MKISKIAVASLLTIAASGGLVGLNTTHARAYGLGTVTASQTKNLVEGQTVTVAATGFGTDTGPATTWYVVLCTPDIVTSGGDPAYCDESDPTNPDQPPTVPNHVTKITNEVNGTGGGTFTIHVGSNWLGTHPGAKCDYTTTCYILVTDGQTEPTTSWAGFVPVTFKDPRASSKTKVSSNKPKAGKTLKITAKTSPKSVGGKVTFKDGHKKLGKVKETGSGKVKITEKHVKKGTHKITASYSGDSNNKPSTGKLKVKVKK